MFFGFELFDLFFQLADFSDGVFLRLPTGFRPLESSFSFASSFVDLVAPFLGMRVLFLQQRLPLDFQLQDAPLDFVDFHWQGIDLHAQTRGRFVDQVNGLVRQETVGNVAMRERGRRQNRRVLDAHAVMHFVALLQAAQNRNRVFDGWLADQHWLESPLQRRIFFDVFFVFVQGRRANRAQFAPRQRRLQYVGSVHRAFGSARTDKGMQFVDEQNDLALPPL